MARSPERLADYPWADEVEAVRGDVLDPATLAQVLEGVDVAYYLIRA